MCFLWGILARFSERWLIIYKSVQAMNTSIDYYSESVKDKQEIGYKNTVQVYVVCYYPAPLAMR